MRKMKDFLIFSVDYQTDEAVQTIIRNFPASRLQLHPLAELSFLRVNLAVHVVLGTHFSCQNEDKSAKTNPSLRPREDDGVVRLSVL